MFANLLVRAFMKRIVAQDGYFFESFNIFLYFLCSCADGFQDLSKAFHLGIQSLTFCLLLLNYLLLLKMLTETSLIIPFSVIQCRPLIGRRENAQNKLVTGDFRYDFTESQAAS
jgi:hypothetical protein